MEPVTEQRQVPGLVVYGYLRVPARSQNRRAALGSVLRSYCDRHELVLGGIFTDSGDDDSWLPGFAGLLDAMLATGGYGVILPSPGHLGTGQLVVERSAAITRAGLRLILIRGALANAVRRRPR
jgi:hypothetical protein